MFTLHDVTSRPAVPAPALLLAPPLAASGRTLAVIALVMALGGLVALMVWAAGRGPRRPRTPATPAAPWEGVRQAAASARATQGDSEQRAAVGTAALSVARADGAQIWELDASGDLVATAVTGREPREHRLGLPAALRHELAEDWVRGTDGVLGAVESGILAATGAARAHLEPMVLAGRLVGFLSVTWDEYAAPPGDDVRSVLALLAAHGALVAERGELQRSARTDVLTGLPNRRAFEDALRREMNRASRLQTPLTVALLDLDGFKQLNDTAGHAAGDAALRAAAAAWGHALRSIDVLARYGGDEFIVLLPQCSLQEAQDVLDRMRLATPLGLGASIGVTSWRSPESSHDLVARADAALYASKRGGRNRTTSVDGPQGNGEHLAPA